MRKDLQEQIEKAKKEIQEELLVTKPQDPPNFTGSALGIFKDTVNGRWYIAEVEYNPNTEQVSVLKKNGPFEDRASAIETFKIKAVNLGLVS